MKVVILAGGFGSRISEESHLKPKPMIEIGGMPMLWHVMKCYAAQGFTDFVICAGYKQHVIKEWFADYFLHSSDVTFDYTGGSLNQFYHNTSVEPWRVTVADTGYGTLTAGRVLRVQKYLDGEPFMLTYGDGVSDLNPKKVLAFHQKAGATVTLTGVTIDQRFGVLDVSDSGQVNAFHEKHDVDPSVINGGFMVCEPSVFDVIRAAGTNPDKEDFSSVTLEWLAEQGRLACYRHEGFWACMDTQRDKERLEHMWESGNAPWRVW